MPDYRVQVQHRIAPPAVAGISGLLAAAAAADGHPPLDEQRWLDLVRGRSEGLSALLVDETGDTAGARGTEGAAEAGGAGLVGYGQLTGDGGRGSWTLELVVHPAHRGGVDGPGAALLGAAVDEARRQGGGRLHYWASKATPQHDAVAAALGFAVERDLLQLRVPLPLPDAVRRAAEPIAVRPFRPGHDEDAWLEVNNRAFAGHPEQGGWDLSTLQAREEQPWFDPAGFLLFEEGGRLAGSCWTKIHPDATPPLGEIYVISVDPARHHRGLGRSLVVAGLDQLAGTGLTTGMLYVDGANDAALALYRSLGFTLDHVDRAYVLEVSIGQAPGGEAPGRHAIGGEAPGGRPPESQPPEMPTARPIP